VSITFLNEVVFNFEVTFLGLLVFVNLKLTNLDYLFLILFQLKAYEEFIYLQVNWLLYHSSFLTKQFNLLEFVFKILMN
jgi:hypothetical protein